MKRIISLFLCAALLFSLCTGIAGADGTPSFTYNLTVTKGGIAVPDLSELSAGDTVVATVTFTRTDIADGETYEAWGLQININDYGLDYVSGTGFTYEYYSNNYTVVASNYEVGGATGEGTIKFYRITGGKNDPFTLNKTVTVSATYTVADPTIAVVTMPNPIIYEVGNEQPTTVTNGFTLTLDPNGGSFVGANPSGSAVVPNTEVTLPDASKDDMILLGWSDGNSLYSAGDNYTVKNDVTLTAVWGADVRFQLGDGALEDGYKLPENRVPPGTVITLPNAQEVIKSGYALIGWQVVNEDTYDPGTKYTVNLNTEFIAVWQINAAEAPQLDAEKPQDLTLTYGYTTGNTLTVEAAVPANHTVSYQWYKNTSASNTGGELITGADTDTYTVPTGKAAGTTEYYYCAVTVKRNDNNDEASVSSRAATVTVVPASVTLTADSGTKTYNGLVQSVSGFTSSVDGLSFTGVSASGGGTNAGEYAVTFSGVTLNETKDTTGNYVVTAITAGKLTIGKAANAIAVDITGWTYGDDAHTPTCTAAFGADTATYTYCDREDGLYKADVPGTAGIWYVKATVAETADYSGGEAIKSFEIAKKTLTIQAKDQSIYIGDSVPEPDSIGFTVTGLVKSDRLTTSPASAYQRDGQTVTADLVDNNTAGSYDIVPFGAAVENADSYTIIYRSGTLTVSAPGEEPKPEVYQVYLPVDPGAGDITMYLTEVGKDTIVTIVVTPQDGYEVDKVSAKDSSDKSLSVKRNANGTYSIVMPASDVYVDVSFAKIPTGRERCFRDLLCPISEFSDSTPTAWYHDGIHFCLENEILRGYGDGTLRPERTTTRAELVQILYNMEGRPEIYSTSAYDDVNDGDWYIHAIVWATENHIVEGYGDGNFGPNDPVTHEQIAKIIYRYAVFNRLDVSASKELTLFPDADQVSSWAVDYIKWAVGAGLIEGRNEGGTNVLAPKEGATRAEVATLIMRFCTRMLPINL